MDASTLEAIGLTAEDLQDRVVNKMVESLLTEKYWDEDGDEYISGSAFKRKLDQSIKKQIDDAFLVFAEQAITPTVGELIKNTTLQQTNKWGEQKGEPVTFIEYLVACAERYMTEQVDHEGKSKTESNGYSWSGKQTRITHMIHQHLHYEISTAMKQALAEANSSIAKGIHEACRLKLNEIVAGIKVTTELKR